MPVCQKFILKPFIRHILASGYYATGHFKTALRGKVAILMYHRVLSEKEISQEYVHPGMYVMDKVFDMQMRLLKERFHVISLKELLCIWEKKTFDETKRYCVITFDDGWLDNYAYAYPILIKYDIPATIFLPTALIGTNRWFWHDKVTFLLQQYASGSYNRPSKSSTELLFKYPWLNNVRMEQLDSVITDWKILVEDEIERRLEEIADGLKIEFPPERKLLNWQEIEEMSRHNISFGSHSSTHKILTLYNPEVVQKEIEDSMNSLQNKQINYVSAFCYPNGNYNKEITNMVKAAGYKAAVTTTSGLEDGSSDPPFSLSRVGIHNDISSTIPLFLYRLSKKVKV